jgi:hypothetical protein
MSKDPAVLFYSDNFLTGTMFMTDDQVGKYMRSLCAQQLHGHLTFEQLNSFCKDDKAVFSKFKKDDQGLFFNERMDCEISKRKSHCDHQRNNALKRWSKNTKSIPNQCHGNATALPLGNGNGKEVVVEVEVKKEEVNICIDGDSATDVFELFRRAYPGTKRGFQTEFLNFCKKHKDWKDKVFVLLEALNNQIEWRKEMASAGMFVPEWKMFQTWINQRCWEEEKPEIVQKQQIKKSFGRKELTIEELKQQAERIDLSCQKPLFALR